MFTTDSLLSSTTREPASQDVELGLHPLSPHTPHPETDDDLRPHEYEDIQELRATSCNDGGLPDEPNVLTQCPAYGPVTVPSTPPSPPDDLQPPVYEDIRELHANGGGQPDEPNVFTQCPAYGPVKAPSIPQYEELHNNGGSSPDEPNIEAQYTFTQCPAYDTTIKSTVRINGLPVKIN